MRKIFLFMVLLFTVSACSTVQIPKYLHDKNPYVHKFYGTYDEVLALVKTTLSDFRWTVSEEHDPNVFEIDNRLDTLDKRQVLIFTEIRQTPMFLGTRYGRMNLYVREQSSNWVEVEIRYLTVNSIPFKSFFNYRKKSVADRFFKHMELLQKEKENQ